jgi:glyoxylase I family protein
VYAHVAAANYGIARALGTALPSGIDPKAIAAAASDKGKVVQALKDSFAHFRSAVLAIQDADLNNPQKMFGRDTTVRGAFFLINGHYGEHLGQSIAYARQNGIVPPWSEERIKQEAEKPKPGTMAGHSSAAGVNLEKVNGIGGLFFRAKDPKGLAEWYRAHLGVAGVPNNYGDPPWQQEAGPTVYAPFPADTKYFGDPAKQWMINFRVHDLDSMAAQLRAAGIAIEIDPEKYPNGRFARLHDPEGNPIELWQPEGKGK